MSKGIMIAATGSGRGKTTFVTGLLNVLKNRFEKENKSVHAFKCGPDYIDPMYHKEVLGIPSTNLDSYFCEKDILNKVYEENAGDINIIEAAMGLYDGIGTTSVASAYEIASLLNLPIVLLVDGRGMGFSIVPLIKGFLSLDNNGLIKGIVINRISENYYKKIAPVIEHECDIKVLGFLPVIKGAELSSRHLGLLLPSESEFRQKLSLISSKIEENVDIENVIILPNEDEKESNCVDGNIIQPKLLEGKTIAIAKDEAFIFCYEENIKLLEKMGANIVYFSPLHDKLIPDGSDGIILYGGYPENYAEQLSSNVSMLDSIKKALRDGVKIIAECGGFMYLLDEMEVNGKTYSMAGVIKGRSYKTSSLVRFGYVSVKNDKKEICVKAHEFHHFDVEGVDYSDDYIVRNESSGNEYKGIYKTDFIFAGFPHLYYLSDEAIVEEFFR